MLSQVDLSVAALLCKSSMTAQNQTAIESEIDRIAAERHCTGQRAAQLIHVTAYPEAR